MNLSRPNEVRHNFVMRLPYLDEILSMYPYYHHTVKYDAQMDDDANWIDDICFMCGFVIGDGAEIDLAVRSHASSRGPWFTAWSRELVHLECTAVYCKYHDGLQYVNTLDKYRNYRLVISNSARAFLLLMELGLPQDIAWPIVAGAYWLL